MPELPEVETVARDLRSAMAGAEQLRVPLDVDVKVGDNWGEMTPMITGRAA